MQTFVPLYTYSDCARVLDNKRLNKQTVEGYQILRTLTGVSKGWRYHPATLMWRGYENELFNYVHVMCIQCLGRGFKNTIVSKLPIEFPAFIFTSPYKEQYPNWWGDERVHKSHRESLYKKDPVFYGKYKWHEDFDSEINLTKMSYWWPVQRYVPYLNNRNLK